MKTILHFRSVVALCSLALFVALVSAQAPLDLNGNARQTRANGGLAKAMIFISDTGTILRGFNSYLDGAAATTLPCGFTSSLGYYGETGGVPVTVTDHWSYTIDFGFRVDDRFVAITPSPAGLLYGVDGNPNKIKISAPPDEMHYYTVIVF